MTVVVEPDIKSQLQQAADEVDLALSAYLACARGVPDRLVEAMRYSLEAGGKRVRPALVLWCCELCGGGRDLALPAAMAVECVHTFSLIHDDLPALDDDDLRRGRATSHKRFGEAVAILAGDALLALAFEIIGQRVTDAPVAAGMTSELAEAAGWRGMIGGEVADLLGEEAAPDRAMVEAIHAAKTARLIEAACRLGGLAAAAEPETIETLGCYGHALGLAFQAADDLLDATSTSDALGKRTAKDAASGKQTYVRSVGMEGARAIAAEAAGRARASLSPFGARAFRLCALARYVVQREA